MHDETNNTILVTRRGLALLQAQLAQTREELRETQGQKGEAAEVGGNAWHDNFAFEELERRERLLNWKLAQLARTLETARVIGPPASTAAVAIGHRVRLSFEDIAEKVVTLGGHGESDPAGGVVAYDTPLGAAILGAEVGEERTFAAGGRRRVVTVEEIFTERGRTEEWPS